MKNEAMINIDLIGNGIDYRFDVPAEMFFELVQIAPEMIERFGIESSKEQYTTILEKVKSQCPLMKNASWYSANRDTEAFMRRCQMVAVLGASLYDIPLMYSADNVLELMEQAGAINITELVEAGLIPIDQMESAKLFKERCMKNETPAKQINYF